MSEKNEAQQRRGDSASDSRGREVQREPIAIVGIGCRLPGGANDPTSFWRMLRDGVDAITEIPPDRWSIKKFYDPEPGTPGKTNLRWGGFINDIDKFDATFFGISPREAARMDPQQRMLLEVAWESLEDAGLLIERLSGSNTGVFIGLSSTDFMLLQQSSGDISKIDAHTNTGGAMSIASNRISYCLDLQGPSLSIDTACSSSLVAMHEACQSIWSHQCPIALAGGVNLLLKPEPYIGFSRLSMLSPDGRCKAFDADADGFVRSEGASIIVLRPLADALAAGDAIYAVVRGTACNQDGHTTGLTVPSETAQEQLVRDACRNAGVDPKHVQFVEAHGPGTLVGDPIEARALGAALSDGRSTPCALGSAKTNVGHLEPAAGIVGVVKVALALKYGMIPPNLHFTAPNPNIDFDRLKLRVPTELEPWSEENGLPLAGVNSFGFGGTNAHVVMEQFREEPAASAEVHAETNTSESDRPAPIIVPLSARSPEALTATARGYHDFLAHDEYGQDTSMADIGFTTVRRRSHHEYRLGIVARDREELLDKLDGFAEGETRVGMASGRNVADPAPKILYVCCGQGPQWWAMGRELMETEPVFRDVMKQCDEIVRGLGPWSLWDELMADEADSRIQDTRFSQPAIFAIQVALARLWESWGVRPDGVVGHSVGEVAAAHLAGALSLEDGVTTIYHRGRCMEWADQTGKMLAAAIPADEAQALLNGNEDKVSVAAVNSPGSVTLSGDSAVLERVAQDLESRGIFNKFLRVQFAFHSPGMEPMKDRLLDSLQGIRPRDTEIPLYSTVSGGLSNGNAHGAEYWWHNVRESVRFAPAIEQALDEGYNVFVELSPHPVLVNAVSETAQARHAKVTVLHSLRREEPERANVLGSLAALHTIGVDVNWDALVPEEGRFTRLPTYAWQRESFWSEGEESRQFRLGEDMVHPLLGKRVTSAQPAWENHVDSRVLRYLGDHRVQGQVLLSGTSYLEMALAAAHDLYGPGPYVVEEVELHKACFLPGDDATQMQVLVDPDESRFNIYSRPKDNGQAWTDHVNGKVRVFTDGETNGRVDLDAIRKRCPTELTAEECYHNMEDWGLDYGPTFRGLQQMWSGKGEALGRVEVPQDLKNHMEGYQAHPAVLDACFQVLTGTIPTNGTDGGAGVYLPVEFERVRVRGRVTGELWSHARVVERNGKTVVAEIDIFDDEGRSLVEVRGLRCQAVDGAGDAAARDARELVYEYQWQLKSRADQAEAHRTAGFLPGPERVAETTSAGAERLASDLGLTEKYAHLEKEINTLCVSFMLEAFRELGFELKPQERFTTDDLSKRMGVDERYWRLMHRYIDMLEADGLVRRDGAEWEVQRTHEIGTPLETWQKLLAHNPAFYAELTLLGRCAQHLAEILRGEADPLHYIFPDGSLDVAEHLYQDSPSLRFYNTLVQRAVSRMLENLPEGRTLRVLEIGAGTGGMSSYVLPKLPDDRTEYVYTDLSNHFFLKAQEKFAEYPFIEYKRLDVEQEPAEQGFELHSFDLILASECLHATEDLSVTLTNVNKLLASEGLLLLLEAVTPVRWVDLVFGLTEGWWRFTDTDLRESYPLLTMPQWRGLLARHGYSDIQEASGRGDNDIENAVILARGPEVQHEADPVTAEAEEQEPRQPGAWLIYADRGGNGAELADLLRAEGEQCSLVVAGDGFKQLEDGRFEIDPASREDVGQLLGAVHQPDAPTFRGIVHLWNLDAPSLAEADKASLDANMVTGLLSGVHLAHVLSESDAVHAPRLWFVTRAAQSVNDESELTEVPQASAWGLSRVIRNEVPKIRSTSIDLDPAGGPDALKSLCAELLADDAEDEVALRGAARYVHRYIRTADHEDSPQSRTVVRSGSQPYRLEVSRQGTLDKLTLRACKHIKLEPNEVRVQVAAAGLNFADVMKALGLYPGLPDGPIPLGAECAGRVTAVGSEVKHVKPGDEVVAIAKFSFGAFATSNSHFVALKPPHLSFEEAATIPVTFLTSHYALTHLGRMRKGEKVLIHSATGGVGLAAIQLARQAGAEVFATAGTPEKRDFLRSLGIEHVWDSRTLEFADGVMEATDGKGVDLVLNSLAGEAIRKSLAVLGSYGRFLEIGKRDIYANSRLGLKPFRNNLSFFSIDLDRVINERMDELGELFRDLMDYIAEGELTPLPYRVFPLSNAAAAFRYMAKAKHIGKIVVSMHEPEVAIAPANAGAMDFSEDATYLMTGGLGGFGLTVAKWMIERGARHLVLVGRSGAGNAEAEAAVAAMREAGAEVVVAKADATDREQIQAVLDRIDESMPPLKGVMHAAMVLKDRLLMDLNLERMHEVWSPKVNGAWNLHSLTRDKDLDFFVLFSSLSSVFGIGGQANYASGNAFLDALSYYRHAQGLPSVTVSWGYLGQVGWVARHDDIAERLETQGVRSFTPQQALTLLGRFIQEEPPHVGVMNIDWQRWGEASGSSLVSPRFADLVRAGSDGAEDAQKKGGSALRKALLAAGSDERQEMMVDLLRDQVARVLGASPSKLDVDKPLTELGLDSLMAVELRNWIEGDLRLSVPTVELMKGPSVNRLADVMLEQLAKLNGGSPTPAEPVKPVAVVEPVKVEGTERELEQAEDLLANVDGMSDEQVDAMLKEMAAKGEEATG